MQFSHSSVGPLDRRPATQAVHLLPPADVSVSVTEPTGHDSHAADSLLLKKPDGQLMQDDATPALSEVLRFLPAAQLLQKDWPSRSWNLPASQPTQASGVEAATVVEKRPAEHLTHCVLLGCC